MIRTFAIVSLLALTGCAHGVVGSVVGGDCKIAHTPTYAVKGKIPYDQKWIDNTTERLVAGCKQPRPKARPKNWDARPEVRKPVVADKPRGFHILPAALRPDPEPVPVEESSPSVAVPDTSPQPPRRPPPTIVKTPWWHWKWWFQ